MSAPRRQGDPPCGAGILQRLRDRLVKGMLEHGLSLEYAERIYRMIPGFGGYGIQESHAASFALIGYASCYLKQYHPRGIRRRAPE